MQAGCVVAVEAETVGSSGLRGRPKEFRRPLTQRDGVGDAEQLEILGPEVDETVALARDSTPRHSPRLRNPAALDASRRPSTMCPDVKVKT